MKTLALLILVLFIELFTIAQTGEISIKLTGIDVQKGGEINVAVFNENGFPNSGSQIAYKIIEVEKAEISLVFNDMAQGVYAVAVFQDFNSDSELSKNFFGVPTELYGFSKNRYSKGGSPNFEEVSFKLESGKRIVLTINLQYFLD